MHVILAWFGAESGGPPSEMPLALALGLLGPCLILGVLGVLVCEYRKATLGHGIAKTFTAATFLAVAVHGQVWSAPYGAWLLLGLCLGFLGDVFLI